MKACSYCGHDCADNAVSCPGCGMELVETPKESPSGPFGRPPRPEAASFVLKTFSQEASAHQAVATLRAARIEAFIATDDCGGLYPPLSGGSPFRLIVSEVHREAADQVLADREVEEGTAAGYLAGMGSTGLLDSTKPPGQSSTPRYLWAAALGVVAGVLLVLGYQRSEEKFSGTDRRDINGDGRTDIWDTYVQGQYSRMAIDQNGDEQPDSWNYYQGDLMTKWEEDVNFDGKIDIWGTYDARGMASQSKADVDFDGKPDVTHFYQFGLLKECHYILPILPDSSLVWKKAFYTNGILREELLDRDRDGKFDEKLFFDVFGVEVKKERLN
jgi:hypothetical protein